MKKLLTTLLAAAMLITAAIPVFAAEADPTVPAAKSGDKTLTGVTASGEWTVTDDAVTTNKTNSNFVFTNDKMEAGKITVTIDRTSASSSGHDGIIFCASGDTNTFWEQEINSYYFMFVEGGNGKIGLAKSGKVYGGWKTSDFPNRYEIPAEDQTGVYELTAEWDCSGTIKAYLNGEEVFTWNDPDPLPGSRYGLRAASVGVSFKDIEAEAGEVAEGAIRNGNANAIPGTITVDGVIDDAWADAPVYTMENEVSDDSRGDAATKKDSSTVQFRMMYSDTKVYMLVEVEDDAWTTGSNTNWRNDSLMIFVSENDMNRGTNNENRYCMVAFLENYEESKAAYTGFFTRSNNGTNDKAKEHAVVKDGNKAVMELSFELNNETPVEGGMIAMDLQYNDQDQDPATAPEQSRTIVWSWSCSANNGPNNTRDGVKGWGNVWFVAEPACTHAETELKDAKEATATEDGYTGDKVCKKCGETVEKGEVIPANGTVNPNPNPNPGTTPDPKPETSPKTGDAALAVSALALVALAGAVVIARRRKVTE